MNLRNWLVRLYPRAWRERYGEEFEILLEECLRSPADVVDIALGALDAHLEIFNGMDWRMMNRINKLRTSAWMVFAGYIGFVIAGMSLLGLVDDSPAAPLLRTSRSLLAAWRAIQVGSVVALLAVLIGGLPIALTVIRRALTSSRRDLRYLFIPVAAFLVFGLYVIFMYFIAAGRLKIPGVVPQVTPENFPTGNRILVGGLMLVFVLGAIVSTFAVWKILTNTDEEEFRLSLLGYSLSVRLYGFAYLLAVVSALGMLLMLAATLVFGRLSAAALPGWYAGHEGLLMTSTRGSFGATVTIMILSAGLAILGVARGYPAWKGNHGRLTTD